MRELWEETPCEHGFMGNHWMTEDGKPPEGFTWQIGRPEQMCPGGSRRRVRISKAAASVALTEAAYKDFPGIGAVADVMVSVVLDAALVTEEGT